MRRHTSVSVIALALVMTVGSWADGAVAAAQEAAAGKGPMTQLTLKTTIDAGPDKQVEPLFTGPGRRLVQITLRNKAVLDAHKAPMPITIHCVAGSGTLTVTGQNGPLTLTPGTLVTIEPDVVHEIVATPAVSVLLTQFPGR